MEDVLSGVIYGAWIGIVASIIIVIILSIYKKIISKPIFEIPTVEVLNKDIVIVEASVAGKQGYIIVDSGCNTNIISSNFLEGVDESYVKKDPYKSPRITYTATHKHTTYPCLLDISIGNLTFVEERFLIMEDFININDKEQLGLDLPIIGLVGYKFMSEHKWVLDTNKCKLYYYV